MPRSATDISRFAALNPTVDFDRRSRRRIFQGVIQDVEQHLLHEHEIHWNQGEFIRKVYTHRMIIQAGSKLFQG